MQCSRESLGHFQFHLPGEDILIGPLAAIPGPDDSGQEASHGTKVQRAFKLWEHNQGHLHPQRFPYFSHTFKLGHLMLLPPRNYFYPFILFVYSFLSLFINICSTSTMYLPYLLFSFPRVFSTYLVTI